MEVGVDHVRYEADLVVIVDAVIALYDGHAQAYDKVSSAVHSIHVCVAHHVQMVHGYDKQGVDVRQPHPPAPITHTHIHTAPHSTVFRVCNYRFAATFPDHCMALQPCRQVQHRRALIHPHTDALLADLDLSFDLMDEVECDLDRPIRI